MKRLCALVVFSLLLHLSNPFFLDLTSEGRSREAELANKESGKHKHVQKASIGSKICYPPLGCFVITEDFFHPVYRPINFLPLDPATIGTEFLLYTRDHPKELYSLSREDTKEIAHSLLDALQPTIFIVHGFFDSRYYGKWMEITKDNILLNSNVNVIIVDWSKGNGAPYTQAAANARVVGAEIAFMIKKLEEIKGISPMNCHIVGHSLGAHAAAYAGERLKKLGRITGLDPAQPYFQNMPPGIRLDPTDADFVDVIHTDSTSYSFLALGMSQTAGHIDFYPNNGRNQPGCRNAAVHSILVEGLIDAARRFVSCNHQRAVDFFAYSINYKKVLPVAYQCKNWESYLDGECSSCGQTGKKCAIMGLRAEHYKHNKNDSQSIKMYLATSGSAPFWEYTYKISIKLKKPKVEYEDKEGEINIKIQGTKKIYDVNLSRKTGNLIHGSTYNFLFRQDQWLGDLKTVTFSWKTSSWNFFKTHIIYLDYVKVIPMNVNSEKEQNSFTTTFCSDGKGIKSKEAVVLTECE